MCVWGGGYVGGGGEVPHPQRSHNPRRSNQSELCRGGSCGGQFLQVGALDGALGNVTCRYKEMAIAPVAIFESFLSIFKIVQCHLSILRYANVTVPIFKAFLSNLR